MVARSGGRDPCEPARVSEKQPQAGPRFPGVRAPQPLLDPEAEKRLTDRQKEILDELETAGAEEGFSSQTMAEIAARMNCSLRTLYGIAPTRDELLLTAVDRRLRRIGRKAIEKLDPTLSPLELLRAYLRAANAAVQPQTLTLSRDFSAVSGSRRLADAHENYVISVVQKLLDRAVAEKQIQPVDTAAVAHILGGLGREFTKSDIVDVIDGTPAEAANQLLDLLLRGLSAPEG